ncbi:radical SAM protein [Persephonella sp.]
MKYVFGPVNSRRFGLSLGIDLSPDKKSCNFDCLYCELGKGKNTNKIQNEPEVSEVINEVSNVLKKINKVDVLTVTSNGEPTLYSKLDLLIERLNEIKRKEKTLILSNGSTISSPVVRQILFKFDIVKLSLDTANEKTFFKLDRPLKDIKLREIIEGMISFRKIYKGELIIEILIVEGINDTIEEMILLKDVLNEIKPDRIDIGTIDRPPAYNIEPISSEKLFNLSEVFLGFNINVIYRNSENIKRKITLNEEDVLNTLRKRPLTISDIQTLYDNKTQKLIETMLDKKILKIKNVGNVSFIFAR